jgi:thymidine phosphorylase
LINDLARVAGCPSDKFPGIYLCHSVGARLKTGEKFLTLYSDSKARLREAIRFYAQNNPIKFK